MRSPENIVTQAVGVALMTIGRCDGERARAATELLIASDELMRGIDLAPVRARLEGVLDAFAKGRVR